MIRYVSAKGLLDPTKGYSLEYNLSGTADNYSSQSYISNFETFFIFTLKIFFVFALCVYYFIHPNGGKRYDRHKTTGT